MYDWLDIPNILQGSITIIMAFLGGIAKLLSSQQTVTVDALKREFFICLFSGGMAFALCLHMEWDSRISALIGGFVGWSGVTVLILAVQQRFGIGTQKDKKEIENAQK